MTSPKFPARSDKESDEFLVFEIDWVSTLDEIVETVCLSNMDTRRPNMRCVRAVEVIAVVARCACGGSPRAGVCVP